MDIDNMPIKFAYDNACQSNEYNQSLNKSMTEHEDIVPLDNIDNLNKNIEVTGNNKNMIAVQEITNNLNEEFQYQYNIKKGT